jgi:hypothetical protein
MARSPKQLDLFWVSNTTNLVGFSILSMQKCWTQRNFFVLTIALFAEHMVHGQHSPEARRHLRPLPDAQALVTILSHETIFSFATVVGRFPEQCNNMCCFAPSFLTEKVVEIRFSALYY